MRIVMMTNTYLPHVSGVAQSVLRFTHAYRAEGHRVLIVAPQFEGQPERETDVVRVPALQNFNGSDFSLVIPIPGYLSTALDDFVPDLVHSHHPFLLGTSALKAAAARNLPLVTTYHTNYEHYTHYAPFGADRLRGFIVQLSAGYANRCDHVIAPSASVERALRARGVERPITVIPTGVDVARFAHGNGQAARQRLGIPPDAFVLGYVGRLAPEKNLAFLARAAVEVMKTHESVHLLLVGHGPARDTVAACCAEAGAEPRLHAPGSLDGQPLVDAYHAMDAFVFASQSETQGMVLVEAMAAGKPVFAIDGPGVREVVDDGRNGRLLPEEDAGAFARVLGDAVAYPQETWDQLRHGAHDTAEHFSTRRCAQKALALYEDVIRRQTAWNRAQRLDEFDGLLRLIEEEWRLWMNRLHAAGEFITPEDR